MERGKNGARPVCPGRRLILNLFRPPTHCLTPRLPNSCRWMRCKHPWGVETLSSSMCVRRPNSLKSAAELRQLFQERGVAASRGIVTYCTIGARASEAATVLRYLLGYPDVRVYDGSWAQWGTQPQTPIEA